MTTSLSLNNLDLTSNRFLRLSRGFTFPYKFCETYSFIFFHQGLSSSDMNLIRSILIRIGLNVTHIPSRFWSNFIPKVPFVSRKIIHGGTLLVHIHPSSSYLSSFSFNRRLYDYISSNSSSNFRMIYKNISNSCNHPILPWDSITSDVSSNWFDSDPLTNFFSYISSKNITYVGHLSPLYNYLRYDIISPFSSNPYSDKISFPLDPLFFSSFHKKFILFL